MSKRKAGGGIKPATPWPVSLVTKKFVLNKKGNSPGTTIVEEGPVLRIENQLNWTRNKLNRLRRDLYMEKKM